MKQKNGDDGIDDDFGLPLAEIEMVGIRERKCEMINKCIAEEEKRRHISDLLKRGFTGL